MMPEAALPSPLPFNLSNPDPNMNMMADGHRDTGHTAAAASSTSITTPSTGDSPSPPPPTVSELTSASAAQATAPPAQAQVQSQIHDSDSPLALGSAPSTDTVQEKLKVQGGNFGEEKDMEGLSMRSLKAHAGAGLPSSNTGASASGAQSEAEGREVLQAGEEVEVDVGSTTLAEQTLVEGVGINEDPTTITTRTRTHVKGPSSSSLSLPPPIGEEVAGSSYSYGYPHTHGQKRSVDSGRYRAREREGQTEGSAAGHSHSHSYSEEQPRTATMAAAWDPLKGTDDGHADVRRRGGTQEDTVVVIEDDGEDVVDSKGKLLFPDDDEELGARAGAGGAPVSAVARRASHLRLDLKPAPASPLPWEQIDPPPDNNSKSIAGYYSPVASQKFRTLQNSGGGARPLIPKSSYYFGPPAPDSAYGTPPVGQIGVHHPREILRVERDYTGGELIQFAPIYPLELEGRITPTHFLESINAINELLISAHSLRHSLVDNALAIFSLQISKLFVKSHFEKEMTRLRALIDDLNAELYNPVGLNILWPRNVAFLYLEIEYYTIVPMDRATFLGVEGLGNQGRGLQEIHRRWVPRALFGNAGGSMIVVFDPLGGAGMKGTGGL